MSKDRESMVHEELFLLATAVRDAFYAAAVTAYEDARIDGLCHDGAWERALETMRAIQMETVSNNK